MDAFRRGVWIAKRAVGMPATAILILALVGCGNDSGGGAALDAGGLSPASGNVSPADERALPADVTVQGAPADPARPAAPAPAVPATDEQVVAVRISDESIEVSPTTVRPGRVVFQVTNNATSAQEVEIDGPGDDGEIDDLPPNQTWSLSLTLRRGEYEIKSSNERGRDRTRRTLLAVRD